jgi:hypothetical protein
LTSFKELEIHSFHTSQPSIHHVLSNLEDLAKMQSECANPEGVEAAVKAIRYDVSIYDTPFSKLPDPKRVWLGSPLSALEGLGLRSRADTSDRN